MALDSVLVDRGVQEAQEAPAHIADRTVPVVTTKLNQSAKVPETHVSGTFFLCHPTARDDRVSP